MRAFDFAVRQILPPDMHRDKFDFSKKGLAELMLEAAQKHPDKYAQISQGLGNLGRNNAWFEGFTVTDDDMEPVIDRERILAKMDGELDELRSRRNKMTPDEFTAARDDVMLRYSKIIQDETSAKATAAGNSWARMVSSGARGNAAHTQAILSTPGVYSDAQGRIIPLFVRNGFADGVRPAEHLAGTYGGRAAVVSTKRATAKGGDIAKLLNQNASKYNITEVDCGTKNGIDLDPLNNTVARRVLARDTAGLPAGTLLDRKSAEVLRRAGKPVIIRSPMTCRAEHGLCAKCYGALNNGKLPSLGDGVGLMAATAISEPIVQGALNVKHNSGMAKGKKSFSGLDYVSQFVQIPEDFKDQAALSEIDGMVDGVREAPQGGYYVVVEGQEHYVPAGTDVIVKPGDRVEAGQELSDGLASARDVVRLRGVGAGRKYYRDRLGQMLADSGNPPDMRNMEVVARANVDSYMVDDPDEDSPFLPDEVVRESALLKFYKPRATKPTPVKAAANKYLDEPVLHYSVGTRVTPSITKHLESVGVKEALVADTPPSFSPHIERLRTNSHDTRDWLESLSTSYLGTQLRESLERGDETNIKENYHFAPRLAVGVDMGSGAFAENIKRTGKF